MGEFENNLLDDLMRDHGARLADVERPPARSGARRTVVRAAAAAVVAAAVVGVTVVGDGTPAYAVTRNPDGTVTVSISDVRAIGPANHALEENGIRARAVPTRKDCAPLMPDRFGSDSRYGTGPGEWSVTPGGDDAVTIAGGIPEGYTVLLTVSPYPGRGSGLGFVAPVRDPAPGCVLDPADDPETAAN